MLDQLRRPGKQRALSLTLDAQQALFANSWPGNVRELNHALRRAIALGAPAEIRAADIFPENKNDLTTLPPGSVAQRSLTEHLEATERAFLIATLQTHNGVMTEAAATLGISRKTLWEKMRRHGIDKQRVGEEAEGLPWGLTSSAFRLSSRIHESNLPWHHVQRRSA